MLWPRSSIVRGAVIDLRGLVWSLLDNCAYLLDCCWSVLKIGAPRRAPHTVTVYFHGVQLGSADGLVDPQEGITPGFLGRFIQVMKGAGYTFVTPDKVLDLDRPSGNLALLTSDDGYRSVEGLLPLLEEERVPLTVFLTTESASRDGMYWWDQIHIAGCSTSAIRSHLKHGVKSRAARDRALQELGIDPGAPAFSESHRLLAPQDVARLAAHPWFSFGNHSRSHLSLPLLDTPQMHDEIEGARREIETWTGRKVRHFAFPYGDYDSRTLRFLTTCGYRTLFTIEPGWFFRTGDLDSGGSQVLPRYRLRADRSATWQARIMRKAITAGPRMQAKVMRWLNRGR